jgi:hypothetical protein
VKSASPGPGALRDPSGCVHAHEGRFLRAVNPFTAGICRTLRNPCRPAGLEHYLFLLRETAPGPGGVPVRRLSPAHLPGHGLPWNGRSAWRRNGSLNSRQEAIA